ncbi:carbohydrate ABC transporter permease [Agromyces sp. GXS1127]|uniref:carbohydrate ABC transporter permease n=1 Tax=Agromyces sp. GXS1127 TaxID=3424181 RepID=UPI003D3197D2
MRTERIRNLVGGIIAIVVTGIIFLVPFIFILLTAMKTREEANLLEFGWPVGDFRLFENVTEVLQIRDYTVVRAFINSSILTVFSVSIMVVLAAMVGWTLQRRQTRWNGLINMLVLAGLIIPPAVVPTIFVMKALGIFATMPGLILIEIAFGLSFCILLFRAFAATVPREIDEAAIIDGAGPIRLFFQFAFPLLRSVIVTVIVVQSVFVFNDFAAPLYFAPGADNVTVQLSLYNFQSQYFTSYNLLFTDILLITIPPLLIFIFFNKQIVAGLTSGAVKG